MSNETGNNREHVSKKRLGKLPMVLGLLGASFMAEAGFGEFDKARQNNARAEATQSISDCRDLVRCTLGKISIAFQRQFQNLRQVDYKLTGASVSLGGEVFKVGKTEEHGDVLEAENGEYFLATHNIENTVANVKAVLASESQE